MFKNGLYHRIYFSIIAAAQARPVAGYTEKHHIIPKSLGGDNTKQNLVRLTAREHFVCHLLLTRMTEGDARKKMLRAAWYMANYHKFRSGHRPSSRVYQAIREANAIATSKAQRGMAWPKDEATREKYRLAWEKRRLRPVSEETREKLRKAGTGQKRLITPEHAAKISASRAGKPGPKKSAETRAKMAESQRKRFATPISEETRRRQSEAQQRRRLRENQAASIA